MRNGENKIFSEKDAKSAGNTLKAIVMRVLIDQGITFDQFSEFHRNYMLNSGHPARTIASDRNNIIRTMLGRNTMTYKMFEYILKNILGFNLQIEDWRERVPGW